MPNADDGELHPADQYLAVVLLAFDERVDALGKMWALLAEQSRLEALERQLHAGPSKRSSQYG